MLGGLFQIHSNARWKWSDGTGLNKGFGVQRERRICKNSTYVLIISITIKC